MVKTTLKWQGDLRFTGVSDKGFETPLDGDKASAPSPMDVLLEAVGGCTGIDVVLILKKMRVEFDKLDVVITGERNDTDPKFYNQILAQFDLQGDVTGDKLARAINLSFEKYCSVFHSLRKDLVLLTEYRINGGEWVRISQA